MCIIGAGAQIPKPVRGDVDGPRPRSEENSISQRQICVTAPLASDTLGSRTASSILNKHARETLMTSHNLVRLRALRVGIAIAVGMAISSAAQAIAAPIMYRLSATGTGQLGATPFTATPFTITSMADTSQITSPFPAIYRVVTTSAVVAITGFPSATFTNPTTNVANNSNSSVGFSDPGQNLAILFSGSAAFAGYQLNTSIGPLSGSPSINPGANFPTSAGNFSLTQIPSNVTFEATLIPEPSTLILFATACIGFLKPRRTKSLGVPTGSSGS